jgi:hypothetical protein
VSRAWSFPQERVYWVVAQKRLHNPVVLLFHVYMWALPSNGHCLQSHRLETNLYATIWRLKCLFHIVMCLIDYRRVFRLLTGFIGHLQIVITSNYGALANSCTRVLTIAHTESSEFVYTIRFLATAPNNVLCLCAYWLADALHLTKLSLSLILRPTVSRPGYLGIKHPSGDCDQIFICLWQLRPCFCGRPLWREDGSDFCICCWHSPA